MPRARIPTLALLLAAGLSLVGPNLIDPEPVATPWSDRTSGAEARTTGDLSLSSGALSHTTAMRASAMPSSPRPATVDARLVATVDPTNRPTGSALNSTDLTSTDLNSMNPDSTDPNEPDERSTTCQTP